MKKRISIPVFIAVILFACLITFQITAVAMMSAYRNSGTDTPSSPAQTDDKADNSDFIARVTEKLTELDSEYRSLYIGDIDEDELINGVMLGYIYGTGDEFAEYYDEESYKTFMEDLSGEGEGIGISVIYNTERDCIEILNIFPDSPASDSGLMVGDLIVSVGEDKEPVSEMGYYVAISRLRGKTGTEAVFTVSRGDGELIDFKITRGPFVEVNVYSHVWGPDPSIGVVRINGFDGMLSNSGFSGQHDAIGSIQYGIGHIRNLRSGRPWAVMHGGKHFSSDNSELALLAAFSYNALL